MPLVHSRRKGTTIRNRARSLQLDMIAGISAGWNGLVAAWFEGGKDDPKLALLRLDAERAEIWWTGEPGRRNQAVAWRRSQGIL